MTGGVRVAPAKLVPRQISFGTSTRGRQGASLRARRLGRNGISTTFAARRGLRALPLLVQHLSVTILVSYPFRRMNELVTVLWQSLLVIMLADFIAGIVHWFEDAYVRENTPLIGSIIGKANVIHHHLPRYMTRNNWWQSSWDLLAFSAFIVLGAAWLDLLTWQV